jgi:uncharacterized membrane protein YfcA
MDKVNMLQLVGVIALSAFAGLLLGVIGGGGGGLYVLLLTFVLNLPIEKAIGTALALSTVTALSGVIGHWRNKNVNRESTFYLSLSSIIGVVGGSLLIKYFPPSILKMLMVITFVLVGLLSLVRIKQAMNGDDRRVTNKWAALIPAGFITGLVSGAFGLSGSTPLASFLVSFTYLPPAIAVGTSLTVVLVTSLAGAMVYLQRQAIDSSLLLILGTGSVVGAYLGAKLTASINKRVLAVTLAVLALTFGVYLFFHS